MIIIDVPGEKLNDERNVKGTHCACPLNTPAVTLVTQQEKFN